MAGTTPQAPTPSGETPSAAGGCSGGRQSRRDYGGCHQRSDQHKGGVEGDPEAGPHKQTGRAVNSREV